MRARLARHTPLKLATAGTTAAAVLVPVRPSAGGGFELVLTRRSGDLENHPGQVAFPGGVVDASDDGVVHTALREAQEELSVPPERVEVLGRLDDALTVTGFHVAPVVGLLPADLELRADPKEVARVFALPLPLLNDTARWRQQIHHWRGNEVAAWHLDFDGEDIWGATARILRGFADILWRSGEGTTHASDVLSEAKSTTT